MKSNFERFSSRRSPVIGTGGMVAASQPLAVAAGLEILSHGGSAADAAVAVAAALNVTEPGSTGLGGDAFALYYEASTRQVSALNGSGRAPEAFTLGRLQWEMLDRHLPARHPYTITVPGACAAWVDLVERFGRLLLAETLRPAIRLAEDGFPVTPITSQAWQAAARRLVQAPGGVELTLRGRAPLPGEIFRNPGLARTLRLVAQGGKEVFYQGEIGAAIAKIVHSAGGLLTQEDLAAHTSTWEEPISVDYRGLRVWECRPNGQGLVALLALKILEGFNLADLPPLSAERLHLEIEALRLAFADAHYYVADPAFYASPVEALISEVYTQQRRRLIDHRRAHLDQEHGRPLPGSDTVYFCVADAEGNACSFVNSNYMDFGTGIVPPGWGFSLQNRGLNFTLVEGHPNAPAPGKRPYHTIIPAMATLADGSLFAAFGVMGGFMQPQGHLQVMVGLVDDDLDPQAALDRPRFCIQDGDAGGSVALEEGIPEETFDGLQSMGHLVERVSGLAHGLFGRGQIILRDPHTAVLWGGSDPRADGLAMPQLSNK